MNREIKFRYYDQQYQRMEMVDMYDAGPAFDLMMADLMQYTGLKDKNGKEIYEGDIVKFEYWSTGGMSPVPLDFTLAVTYKDGSYCFIETLAGKEYVKKYLHELESYQMEIIGNIYENPKSLSKSE